MEGIPELEGVTWRPMAPSDGPRLADLTGVCCDADGGYRMSAGEWADWFGDPADDPAADGIVGVRRDGTAVAGVFCMIPEPTPTRRRIYRWLGITPAARRPGVEGALSAWWRERARWRCARADDDLPAVLYALEYDWMTDRHRQLLSEGFQPVRWDREMGFDLTRPSPPVSCAATITPFDMGRSDASLRAYNEAFAGQHRVSVDAWKRYYVGGDAARPDLSFLAMDGDDVVGVLLADVYPHDFKDKGRTEAWIGGLGTVPAWRGRGVASALIVAALDAFRDEGFEFAVLGADSNNPTGAFRLYERLGFVSERSSTQFAMPAFAPFERQTTERVPTVDIDEDDPVALSRRGDLRRSAGDLEGAAADLSKAVSLGDDGLVTRLRLAILDHHRVRIDEAEEGFAAVLAGLEPGDRMVSFAWQHLGKLRAESGRFASARACLDEAARLRMDEPELLASTARAMDALDGLMRRYRPAG